MRAVAPSLLGLSLLCSTAWAVEPATTPAPAVAPAAPVAPAPTAPHTLPADKPRVIPAVATVNPNGQPQEAQPLTAEQLAKNKALQDLKIKALVKDQSMRLQQLEKANLEALAQNCSGCAARLPDCQLCTNQTSSPMVIFRAFI